MSDTRVSDTSHTTPNDPEAAGSVTPSDNGVLSEKPGTPPQQPEAEAKPEIAPEGGLKGWLCVTGSFLAMIASFGFLNAYVSFASLLMMRYEGVI